MIILGEWQGSTELGLIKDSSKISSLSTGKSPPSSSSTPLSSNSNNYIKLESWLKLSQSPPGSHSQHKSPLPKDDSDSSDSDNHNKLIFIGIGAVVGLLLFLMLVLLICLCKRKRRRRTRDQMGLYMENSYEFKGNDYNSNEQGGNWNNNNYNVGSKDHVVKIPPPTNSHGVSLEYNWPIAPPPPPPMMSSNNFSSTQEQKSPNVLPIISSGFINQKNYTYDELATATGGFSKSNLLGEGGFGYVHKGILPNGKEVAVKSLKSKGGQEEREFQAEVETISRVNHRHLVSLLGYCISGSKRLLVYEFIPNNTLEYHLHGSGNPVMDFSTRLKIAIGTAKGFAYIHEDCHPRIIHRDIKGANILLDNNFEAKVADFGLAKLAADNFTHVSTRIMGTFGYLAPEYASTGKLTERSDVYSYGVMLLELITGLLPTDVNSDGENLVDWATPILNHATEGGNYDELIDPLLEGKFDRQQMFSMVTCAAASIRHSAKRRPKMSQIVHTLEGDVSLLNDLNKAATSGLSGSGESSECEGASNIKKLKRSETSSEEFTSS